MKWSDPLVKSGDQRALTRFAFLPTRMLPRTDVVVWLESYSVLQYYRPDRDGAAWFDTEYRARGPLPWGEAVSRDHLQCQCDTCTDGESAQINFEITQDFLAHAQERIRELEAEVARLKRQLEYGDVTPASSVAAEVAVLRENNEALGLKVNELEAEAAAMREALLRFKVAEREDGPCWCGYEQEHLTGPEMGCVWARAALASDAGKAFEQRIREDERAATLRVVAESVKRDVGPMVDALVAKARAQAFEEAAQVVRKYLSFDSQRAVSWHEVNDAIDAIRAKAKEGT